MSTKQHLTKYACCAFFYIIFCFAVIILKIQNGPSGLWVVNSINLQNNLTIVSTKSNNKNYNIPKLPQKIEQTVIDQQTIDATLERISNVCEKYNKITSLKRTHYLYAPKRNSLFCWIRKVASTSFTKLFLDLRGIQVRGNYYKKIAELAPHNIEECMSLIDEPDVFKFLAVRHPFERLVSFYRSRLENNQQFTAQAWIYVPKIFYITRPQLFHFNESIGTPVQQIFHNNRRLRLIPTFNEFVTWLLQEPEEHDDPHWRQYHSHCSICQIRFDYVLKIDKYSNEERSYFFWKMNLTENEWEFPRLGVNDQGLTNFAQTCSYLSELSGEMLNTLYKRYEIDFEMFDYNYDIYKKCAKN